ncbi:MAG: hypothetical protein ACLFPH_09805 [Bacteroidales bacterium]
MIQDIIKIRPQTQQNYYTGDMECATPVIKPKEKAKHYFRWGLVFHARGKAAEAYKYYEKAIIYHASPLYIKQMGILHHEMGYFDDAIKYLRSAFDIERTLNHNKKSQHQEENQPYTSYSSESSQEELNFQYHYTIEK